MSHTYFTREFIENLLTKITNNIDYRLLTPIALWSYRFLDDEEYTRRMYRRIFDREIDLEHPKTFNEKILYLKLYCEKDDYTQIADKFAVREFVRARGLAHTLNEVYGVYDHVDQIEFDTLPDAFVIQATHGSGWNILCPDKSKLDLRSALIQMRSWLKKNFYRTYRETVYKHIRPRIMISKYLSTPNGSEPIDYKFFCFHGRPVYVQIDARRDTDHRRDFYDLRWKRLPLCLNYPNLDRPLPRPDNLDEMLEVSETLAAGFPFVRVDLYAPSGEVVFGELTLYPGAGFTRFNPDRFDRIFGRNLDPGKDPDRIEPRLYIPYPVSIYWPRIIRGFLI